MKIVYKNNSGDEINLTSDNYKMLRDTDLLNYKWDYYTKNEYDPKIYRFANNMVSKKFVVNIQAKTKSIYNHLCNELTECFEKDVFFVEQGKLIVNDSYVLSCYVIGKSIKEWNPSSRFIANEFELIAESGSWRKTTTKIFGGTSSYEPESTDIDFPHDYPYDYVLGGSSRRLISDSFVPFDFEIVFQGAVDNPILRAGGHIYRVYTSLVVGEYLTINSISKTIVRTKTNGEKVNEFSKRDRDNYIFQKMGVTDGSTMITWTPGTIVTITSFTERSEPTWI